MTRSESITHLATALAKAQAEMPVAVFDATNPFLKSKYASLGSVIQASRPILAKHRLSLVQLPVSNPHPAYGHPLYSQEALNRPSDTFSHRMGEGKSDGRGVGPGGRTDGKSTPHPALSPVGAERVTARGDARPTGEWIGVESILMHESGEFIAERILIPLTEEKGKTKVQCAGSTLTYLRRYSWAAILGMYSDEDSDGVAAPTANMPHGPKAAGQVSPVQASTAKAATALPPPPMRRRANN